MVPPRLLAHVTSSCKQKKWFQILEVVQTTFSEMKCAHCKGSIKVEKTHLDHSPLRTSSPHHTHTHTHTPEMHCKRNAYINLSTRTGETKPQKERKIETGRGRGGQRGNSETASKGREEGRGKGKREFIHPHKSKWVPPHPRSQV